MKIDSSIIEHYLHQSPCPVESAWIYKITQGKRDIEMHRQEVVQALLKQITLYCDEGFPIWNKQLIQTIFQDQIDLLDDLILLPIVGANASFDGTICTHLEQNYLILDVLNIADYTPILTQMHYILHNLIHVSIITFLIHTRYPKQPKTYLEQLESIFFVEGLAQYLSWNEDVSKKRFQNASYEKRKETAFGLLYQAIQINDEATQKRMLETLKKASFWNRFPQVAGMFFMDDLYQAEKEKGLRACYMHGPNSILSIVFQE